MVCNEVQFDVAKLMVNDQFETFSINLNAQRVNGMTSFDLALRLLDTLKYKSCRSLKTWPKTCGFVIGKLRRKKLCQKPSGDIQILVVERKVLLHWTARRSSGCKVEWGPFSEKEPSKFKATSFWEERTTRETCQKITVLIERSSNWKHKKFWSQKITLDRQCVQSRLFSFHLLEDGQHK